MLHFECVSIDVGKELSTIDLTCVMLGCVDGDGSYTRKKNVPYDRRLRLQVLDVVAEQESSTRCDEYSHR